MNMISLKVKMPANTFQAVTKLFEPDLEYQPEAEGAPAVEATLQLSEETVLAVLQTYKDMFPMLVLSSPALFHSEEPEGDGVTRVTMSPEQLMEHMQNQGGHPKKPADPETVAKLEEDKKKGYL